MAVTLTIANQKGGVGKTTLTSMLGVALAGLGYKVVLVDMDPQGHLSVIFDMEKEDAIFKMIVLDSSLSDLLRPIDPEVYLGITDNQSGLMSILPGGQRTQLAAIDIQIRGADFGAFRQALQPLRDSYDFLLIDTSPTVSLFTPAIIQASDYLLIPTEMSRLAFDGVDEIVRTIENTKGMHNASLMGIVPMMTRPNTNEHQERLSEIIEVYGSYVWGEVGIPQSTVWKESADAAMPIFQYVSGHKAVVHAWNLVNRVLESVGQFEVV